MAKRSKSADFTAKRIKTRQSVQSDIKYLMRISIFSKNTLPELWHQTPNVEAIEIARRLNHDLTGW